MVSRVDFEVLGEPVWLKFSAVMRETYFAFARWSALISVIMWTAALLSSLFGL